jgi:hypothetical protein
MVPATRPNKTAMVATAAYPPLTISVAIAAAIAASTATGLESGPAMAKGSPLKMAKRIARTPALTRPKPMPSGRPDASGPEKINAA